ncbi:hypothetical protein EIN_340590 [Entamoeba invadens IP1]|uniref:J domain-containing protein n=1 Tax=Entamoeba invadens IP1 TaxID=370355 RepID=A0A0A1UH53_ENTIV|nr:hypothetical protein EIN_340590 [Entamoeba invadens IP1]ELP94721.1 hypothetical protein EIN_340590 [Entamoeba invadens IP1]|eukprot:XP_004261492.1 hypothetical protein EIN_340590 [Entamoeba invadens IP1]
MSEEKPIFDDQMFQVFLTGLSGTIVVLWVLYLLRQRIKVLPSFPCTCSRCLEKKAKLTRRRNRLTGSLCLQLFFIFLLTLLFLRGAYKTVTTPVGTPTVLYDPYTILEVSQTSSDKDIRSSYRKLSLKYHPDKNKSPEAEEKFIQITKAYETLTDPLKLKLWRETGNEEEKRIEKNGIGLPMFLTLQKNRTVVLGFYFFIVVILFPIGVWLLLRKFHNYDNNNLTLETNAIFMQLIDTNLTFPTLIEVLTLSNEITEIVTIKPDDQKYLPAIQKRVNSLFIKTPKYNSPQAVKAQILLAAHLTRLHNELPYYLRDDLDEILQVVPNILHGMVSVMFSKRNLNGVWQCIRLNQMVTQATDIEFNQIPEDVDSKLFGKNMTFEKFCRLTPEDRKRLIEDRVVDGIDKSKDVKLIQPLKEKSEVKKMKLETVKEKIKQSINEKDKKMGKKPRFEAVEEHCSIQSKEIKEKSDLALQDQSHKTDTNAFKPLTVEAKTRQKVILNYFNYFPTTIDFVVRAMSATMTRTVIAGIPLVIVINAYRYPRGQDGEVLPKLRGKLQKILDAEKEDLPVEPQSAEELLKRPTEEQEDDVDPVIPDVEIVHAPPQDVYVHCPYCPNERLERWWFILTDMRNSVVLNAAHGYIPVSELPFITRVFAPTPKQAGNYAVSLHIVCDSYMGCSRVFPLNFTVVERKKSAEEDLVNGEEEEEEMESDDVESSEDAKKDK